MSQHPAYDFTVDKPSKTIIVKREFAAPLPLVWDAFTQSRILDQWWAPKPWKAETKHMEFKEGGQWLYAMVGPEGERHWSVARYTEIQPRKKFVGLDGFTDEDGNINEEMPQSKWEVTFTDKGEKTLVEIRTSYDQIEQLEAILEMGFKDGFRIALEGLDDLLPNLE